MEAKQYFRCDYSKYQSEMCEGAICIPLTNGMHALISIEDYDLLGDSLCYATRATAKKDYYAYMRGAKIHQHMIEAPKGYVVDHINRNPMDNRRSNLRLATISQNQSNRRGWAVCESKYKGVFRNGKGWQARVQINRKPFGLGTFKTQEEAAMAYDIKAIEVQGEFAYLNFPLARLAKYGEG